MKLIRRSLGEKKEWVCDTKGANVPKIFEYDQENNVAQITSSYVTASSADQRYSMFPMIDFGKWEGKVFEFDPAGKMRELDRNEIIRRSK